MPQFFGKDGKAPELSRYGRRIFAEIVDAPGLTVEQLVERGKKLKAEGVTTVLVEQNTRRALRVADSVCVLASGRAVFAGTAAAARKDSELFSRYLGATPEVISPGIAPAR